MEAKKEMLLFLLFILQQHAWEKLEFFEGVISKLGEKIRCSLYEFLAAHVRPSVISQIKISESSSSRRSIDSLSNLDPSSIICRNDVSAFISGLCNHHT